MRSTAKVFARCQITEGTRIEHEKYVVWINTYAEIMGHGTFVVVDRAVGAGALHAALMPSHADVCELTVRCCVLRLVLLRRRNPGRTGSWCR